nr:MAG TPA: hypothetical protein [Caudoviricetes sp.]
MKKNILSIILVISAGGMTLTSLGVTLAILKEAWDERDLYLCSLGLLLLFVAVLPLSAITIGMFL